MEKQTAVTAYYTSKQLLLFAFELQIYSGGSHTQNAREIHPTFPDDTEHRPNIGFKSDKRANIKRALDQRI